MMRVCYFNYIHDYKESSVGSFVHVNEFVHAFRALGHRVCSESLFLKKGDPASRTAGRERWRTKLKEFLRFFYFEPRQLLYNFRFLVREWQILRRERPDILIIRHSPYVFSGPLTGALLKIPVLLEVNSLGSFMIRRYQKFHLHYPGVSFIERFGFRKADVITVTSEELKTMLVDHGVPAGKISVVPMGVDCSHIYPLSAGETVRRDLNMKNDLVFGFVGSMNHWHGLDILMNLMPAVLKEIPDSRFLFIGDGLLRHALERFAEERSISQRVHIVGYVPYRDINRYINAMDVALAIYPVNSDFFFSPLKLFEYMAAARPVITTAVGQIRMLIRDGETGFFVDPGDPDAMIAVLKMTARDAGARGRAGRAAREYVCHHFSWKQHARMVEQLCLNRLGRLR